MEQQAHDTVRTASKIPGREARRAGSGKVFRMAQVHPRPMVAPSTGPSTAITTASPRKPTTIDNTTLSAPERLVARSPTLPMVAVGWLRSDASTWSRTCSEPDTSTSGDIRR